jgi:hypothetical protein
MRDSISCHEADESKDALEVPFTRTIDVQLNVLQEHCTLNDRQSAITAPIPCYCHGQSIDRLYCIQWPIENWHTQGAHPVQTLKPFGHRPM